MLKWFKKIHSYATLLTGDFERIFKDFSPPPLPQVVMHILEKLSDPEVSPQDISLLIEKDPALSSQVLKIVNSAYFGLSRRISRIGEATSLLGVKEIETLVLSYGVVRTLKDPQVEGFDIKIFWEDSLFRALFARKIAKSLSLEAEEAFAGALLQDVALPVLLTNWYEGYRKVYEKWQEDRSRALHEVEKEVLSWDHAQAGAWVLKNWKLPDVLVCCVGFHIRPLAEIAELRLLKTPIGVVALASLLPSVSRPENTRSIAENAPLLGLSPGKVAAIAEEVLDSFEEFATCLGLTIKPPVEVVRNLNLRGSQAV